MAKWLTAAGLVFWQLLVGGCAAQHPGPSSSYSTLHRPEPPKDSSPLVPEAQGVASENRLTVPVPGGPSPQDLAVGEKIREMLMEDKTLAPAPSNVITVVSKGVVKMKGFVRSRRAANELCQRIAGIPGVISVENELTLWNGHKL
jgi:hypothetical protein